MSENLIDQYKQIHATRQYGDTSIKNLRYLRPQVQVLAPATILDFGCGRSKLVDVLGQATGARITRHDPAIPEFSAEPEGTFDLLTNIDVLEHVPEENLDDVVGKMASLCRNAIIVIDTVPAEAVLPNGENAHCTLRTHAWWQQYLSKHFKHVEPIRVTRRSRAAFRTWPLDPAQQSKLNALLRREKLSYYWNRLLGRK
ncbi:MAG: methyltransferase domain-containing protein [Verrucomicrobiota bacterium]